jgi:hypothetical protein
MSLVWASSAHDRPIDPRLAKPANIVAAHSKLIFITVPSVPKKRWVTAGYMPAKILTERVLSGINGSPTSASSQPI